MSFNPYQIALDLHDFSIVHSRLDLLLRLKERFPDFKVSLFTVSHDEIKDWGSSLIREDNLKIIKQNLDWLQLIPHGWYHDGSEAQSVTESEFKDLLDAIRIELQADGLPFELGYCAPHWRWNKNVVKVLDEWNWWGAVDRDKMMPFPKRFYQYNFLLNEPFYEQDNRIVKVHGHVYGTRNDLGRCFNNLMRLPVDTQFHFVTDYIEEASI